jgi:hypothetical protein
VNQEEWRQQQQQRQVGEHQLPLLQQQWLQLLQEHPYTSANLSQGKRAMLALQNPQMGRAEFVRAYHDHDAHDQYSVVAYKPLQEQWDLFRKEGGAAWLQQKSTHTLHGEREQDAEWLRREIREMQQPAAE